MSEEVKIMKDPFLSIKVEDLEKLQRNKPWLRDARYFKKAQLSTVASTKMLEHAQWGVDNPDPGSRQPREIMGLMFGHPAGCDLIVTDAFPLPVEGTETRVMADEPEVMNYMIQLTESLYNTREDRLIGWYHSHPFDHLNQEKRIDPESDDRLKNHCFLSLVDVQTQNLWQRQEDQNGHPFFALVIDPQNTMRSETPQFGAYRTLTSEESIPMTPRGETVEGLTDEKKQEIIQKYGSCWQSYYELEVGIFSSILSQNYDFPDRWKVIMSEFAKQDTLKKIKTRTEILRQVESGLNHVRKFNSPDYQQMGKNILNRLQEDIEKLHLAEQADQLLEKLTCIQNDQLSELP